MEVRTVVRALKTPVTLVLLVAFVAWAAQWALEAATKPIPPRPPAPCVVREVGPQLLPEHVYVRVYNGTEMSGLAKRLSAILRADGFNTFLVTNTEKPDHETSKVVGHSEDSPEVILVRQAFTEIAFEADARVDRTVDVIIGTQQPQAIDQPEFNAPLPDGTACIPQIQLAGGDG